jgi:hypothetical protein
MYKYCYQIKEIHLIKVKNIVKNFLMLNMVI